MRPAIRRIRINYRSFLPRIFASDRARHLRLISTLFGQVLIRRRWIIALPIAACHRLMRICWRVLMTDEEIGQIAESFVRSEWKRLGIEGWLERAPGFLEEVRRESDRLKRSALIFTACGFEIRA